MLFCVHFSKLSINIKQRLKETFETRQRLACEGFKDLSGVQLKHGAPECERREKNHRNGLSAERTAVRYFLFGFLGILREPREREERKG